MSYVANFSGVFILLAFSCLGRVSGFTYTNCACGKPGNTKNRIMGGVDAVPHEYPWIVAVFYRNQQICGGTLISFKYILTACGCVKDKEISEITIGIHQHRRDSSDGIKVGISNVIKHDHCRTVGNLTFYNIALIKLRRPVKFSPILSPICLSRPDTEEYDRLAMIAGWGRLNGNKSYPEVLQKVGMYILTPGECDNGPAGFALTPYLICAFVEKTDFCQGDMGVPLMYEFERGKWEIIGIAAWGWPCHAQKGPGMYTKVSYFLNWIDHYTPDAVYCIS